MARVTEKKFAAFSVRVWRLIQRLEKLKPEKRFRIAAYNKAYDKLWNELLQLDANF